MLSQDEQWLLMEKYGGEKSEAFFADLQRLDAGEPLAHVIGWVPFLGCKIWLSSDEQTPPIPSFTRHQEFLSGDRTGIKANSFALIPRPETEFWVEKAIAEIKNQRSRQPAKARPSHRVLDLCAGSGCIGVAVAKNIPGAKVDFSEIDLQHLSTIENNLIQNLSVNRKVLDERYHIWQSDLFENIEEQFDFILSNPPYINKDAHTVEDSVAKHEPHEALFGGQDGIELIVRIIETAQAHLTPHGQLWLEHEPEQSIAIKKLGAKHGLTATTHTDQYGTERYSVLVIQ